MNAVINSDLSFVKYTENSRALNPSLNLTQMYTNVMLRHFQQNEFVINAKQIFRILNSYFVCKIIHALQKFTLSFVSPQSAFFC